MFYTQSMERPTMCDITLQRAKSYGKVNLELTYSNQRVCQIALDLGDVDIKFELVFFLFWLKNTGAKGVSLFRNRRSS